MVDPTSADRQRRWRERKRKGETVARCACGRMAYGQHAPFCSRCWLATDAGREWNRVRTAGYRAAKRNGL